jgi:hypothetical protein
MQKNKTLKGLLAVSAVAAMFSAVGVHAQTAVSPSPSQTGTSSTNPNQAGKTTKEGTMDNSNSTGMENRATRRRQGHERFVRHARDGRQRIVGPNGRGRCGTLPAPS